MKYFWMGLAAVFVGAIALEAWARTRVIKEEVKDAGLKRQLLKADVRIQAARADVAEAATIEARALLAQEGTWVQIKGRKKS